MKETINSEQNATKEYLKVRRLQPRTYGRKSATLTSVRAGGWTIIEALVVIGVMAILLALAVPKLAAARSRAKQLTNLAAIRQVGLLVVAYASDNKDVPPCVFPPVYVNPTLGVPWQEVKVGSETVRGAWFMNGATYQFKLQPAPEAGVVRAVDAPKQFASIMVDGTRTAKFADFVIVDPFYAVPEYWTRDKQQGPAQWSAQQIASVAFPSAKAIMWQPQVYGRVGFEFGFPSCCTEGVRSPVLWSDLSATDEVVGKLKKGVPNAWHYGIGGGQSADSDWAPLLATENGIRGRDR